jgi:hypothetical protein
MEFSFLFSFIYNQHWDWRVETGLSDAELADSTLCGPDIVLVLTEILDFYGKLHTITNFNGCNLQSKLVSIKSAMIVTKLTPKIWKT